ncbi:Transcriptional activator of fatty acid utilization [Ciborinia camelliae]|nr:Transcriptional activator of fatty acid utilization [Ciborinia camelliae]
MSALEKLSDVWLVAKMVQGLFGTILKAAGFENYTLEGTKSFKQIGKHKVPVFSFVEEPFSTSRSGMESKEDSLPLTHSLLAHQKATLSFVSGTGTGAFNQVQKSASNNSGISSASIPSAPSMHHRGDFSNSADLWASAAVQTPFPETIQYPDDTFPGNNYMPPEQMATWMQPDFQSMIPTTLNVTDWFDYFGMR